MKKIYLLTVLLNLTIFLTFAQNNNSKNFETKYYDYFQLDRETIFTQLNKTVFYNNNEELWFKTYIYHNKTGAPFISTSNVYATIYDENGTLLLKKIYRAKNGTTNGNFKIDNTFNAGIYYFKTTTTWMGNFLEDYSHVQIIQILDGAKKNNIVGNDNKLTYDFQLLPESGHLVNESVNKVGFKILNSEGVGMKIKSGVVIDKDKNIITSFMSNQFGIGKFTITPDINKSYSVEVILENNERLIQHLPQIELQGVGLRIENSLNDNLLLINLYTNESTLPQLLNKNYFIAIHRDGLLEKIKVSFKSNMLDYVIRLNKSVLLSGINIITLINEKNEPIAERIIFNNEINPIKSISNIQINKQKDSTVITLNTGSKSNLSVSILPSSNESYDDKSTIISKILIEPYINGSIENPRYYFDNMDRKKMYDLDLLLLTQGWSRYSWNNIFNNPPKITYPFETGFQIKGKLNKHDFEEGEQILLSSLNNYINENTDLYKGNYFSFENLYLSQNSKLHFKLIGKNGKETKPIPYYNVFPNYTYNKLNVSNFKHTSNKIIFNNDSDFEAFDVKPENILETVTLKTVTNKKIGLENKPYGYSTGKHITFENEKSLRTPITDYIRRNGFEVINTGLAVRIISRRGAANWDGAFSPKVFIDNIEVDVSSEISNSGIAIDTLGVVSTNQLAALTVEDVEEIFLTHHGNLYAAPGGVIHIFTKTQFSSKRENPFINSTIKFGYSDPKEYYNPVYLNSDNPNFLKFGAISWKPNLVTNNNGEVSFKIPNYTHDDINLYIEGMSDDGSLISKLETISIE